jgi:hypothetical protein
VCRHHPIDATAGSAGMRCDDGLTRRIVAGHLVGQRRCGRSERRGADPVDRIGGEARYPTSTRNAHLGAAGFGQDNGVPPGSVQVPLTHGRVDAPVNRDGGGRPLALYSPGLGGNRDSSTVLVEQLVSRGYVVATIDHTHDASQVEFPDGRGRGSAVPPITPEVVAKVVRILVCQMRSCSGLPLAGRRDDGADGSVRLGQLIDSRPLWLATGSGWAPNISVFCSFMG